MIFFFILITYLVDFVLILWGEILSDWITFKGCKKKKICSLNIWLFILPFLYLLHISMHTSCKNLVLDQVLQLLPDKFEYSHFLFAGYRMDIIGKVTRSLLGTNWISTCQWRWPHWQLSKKIQSPIFFFSCLPWLPEGIKKICIF